MPRSVPLSEVPVPACRMLPLFLKHRCNLDRCVGFSSYGTTSNQDATAARKKVAYLVGPEKPYLLAISMSEPGSVLHTEASGPVSLFAFFSSSVLVKFSLSEPARQICRRCAQRCPTLPIPWYLRSRQRSSCANRIFASACLSSLLFQTAIS